jgi:hypothetical protein
MPEYTVHFTTSASISVKVEAEDADHALEIATVPNPSSLVYASHPRGFDMGGEWEPESVWRGDSEVWNERTGNTEDEADRS